MTDLKDKLRSTSVLWPGGPFIEAADRIEKLESALFKIALSNNSRDRFSAEIDAIILEALSENDHD
jgi:hypothetical protein